MAMPFLTPRDATNEDQYHRLEHLLYDLYVVLRDLITGDSDAQSATPVFHNLPPPPPPPPPTQGPIYNTPRHHRTGTPRGPHQPTQPVRVPVTTVSQPALGKFTPSPAATSVSLQLEISYDGTVSVVGSGQQPAAPA